MTILYRRGTSWRVQFEDREARRRSVDLGAAPKRAVQATELRIERIVLAQLSGSPLDPETNRWLESRGDNLVAKLAGVGLTAGRRSGTLGALIDQFVNERRKSPEI